jgi:alcohol dehydrogenase class IV
MLVTDEGVIRTGWVEKALDSLQALGVSSAVFSSVTPNPKEYEVAAGVSFYAENECDILVAVGGGSPMDCAKGIGVAYVNQSRILEYEGVDEVPMPGPPLICAPTTAGSSADVSQFAIIVDTERRVKIAIVSKTVVPDVSLIDPETTMTMPAELTANTGMDALVHAMEAYVSNASSPVTDLNALGAIPLLVQNLIPAIENPRNEDYRKNMMLGSLLAGLAFSNASLGLVHAMAHSLGGLLDLPHGVCNASLLETVVAFNYASAEERYRQIGRAMELPNHASGGQFGKDELLQSLRRLRESAGISASISQLGVSSKEIPELARKAYGDPCLATNPRIAEIEDIEELYEEALSI